jgi:EAL domain-containing protein (putative c-di-GMP-specific phosphodiesterase class I)
MGLATTAEGVETAQQLDRVQALGCDEVQGFHIARPQPASEIAALIRTFNGRSEAAA